MINISDEKLCAVANSHSFKNDKRLICAKLAIKLGIPGKTTADLKLNLINSIQDINPSAFKEK